MGNLGVVDFKHNIMEIENYVKFYFKSQLFS